VQGCLPHCRRRFLHDVHGFQHKVGYLAELMSNHKDRRDYRVHLKSHREYVAGALKLDYALAYSLEQGALPAERHSKRFQEPG
jgi:hypothetical protein